MAENYDLESSDFNNKNIQINTEGRNVELKSQVANNSAANKGSPSQEKGFIQRQKEAYATSMLQSATEHATKSWYEKCICGLEVLKKYFNVTSADVRSRLLHSLVPFNPKFYDISEQSPDLYGPFWIYTTLIFLIAACGSLAKYINGDSTKNFFQEFVPFAAGMIYGIGFGLPIIITILMKCFGSSTSFVSVICTYGYSYSVFLPIIIVCSLPIDLVQWILIAYAVFSSTSLIIVNYWKELSKYMEKRKYLILAIIICFQVGLFLMLKLYFFKKWNTNTTSSSTNTSTSTNSTNTNTTNSTLLLI